MHVPLCMLVYKNLLYRHNCILNVKRNELKTESLCRKTHRANDLTMQKFESTEQRHAWG